MTRITKKKAKVRCVPLQSTAIELIPRPFRFVEPLVPLGFEVAVYSLADDWDLDSISARMTFNPANISDSPDLARPRAALFDRDKATDPDLDLVIAADAARSRVDDLFD